MIEHTERPPDLLQSAAQRCSAKQRWRGLNPEGPRVRVDLAEGALLVGKIVALKMADARAQTSANGANLAPM